MAYTPDDQLLEPHCDTIVKGIDKLSENIKNRLDDHGEWKDEHLEELEEILVSAAKFRSIINKLRREHR